MRINFDATSYMVEIAVVLTNYLAAHDILGSLQLRAFDATHRSGREEALQCFRSKVTRGIDQRKTYKINIRTSLEDETIGW